MSEMNLNDNRRSRSDVGKETVFTESTVTVDPKKVKKAKKKSKRSFHNKTSIKKNNEDGTKHPAFIIIT